MYIKIKEIKDALEAAYIRSVLEEHRIPFNITEYNDSAYKGFLETKYGFGILEAPIEYKEKIAELIEIKSPPSSQIYSDEENIIPENPSNLKILKLITLSLLVSTFVFGYLYFTNEKKYNYISGNKVFLYEWNNETSSNITRWKTNKKLCLIQTDENLNFFYEKSFSYDLDENILDEFHDKNEDGIAEKKIIYNHKGEISDIYFDFNNDFYTDKQKSKINDNLYIVFEDKDENKEFDKVSFVNTKDSTLNSISYGEYIDFLSKLSQMNTSK